MNIYNDLLNMQKNRKKPKQNKGINYKNRIFFINKNKSNLLLYIIFIINIISFVFSQETSINKKRNLEPKFSELTIIISGQGIKQILNDSFKPIPYYLEVNSMETSFNYTINSIKDYNKIIMKFDEIITSCEYMFYGLSNITQINMTNFDFTEITSMKGMFYGAKRLSSLLLNTQNKISKIKNLESVFYGCNDLQSIELSMLDTSLVTNMGNMFRECYKLKNLNISHFNTALVKNMQYMFFDCSLLTSLNLTNFDTSSVTNMASMFSGCYQLQSLDLTNFKTNLINDINSMFLNCNSLTSLNLISFNTSLVKNMSSLFKGCISIEILDINHFNTSLVKDMSYMFHGCTEITKFDLLKFNTTIVNNMEYMFGSCYRLTSLKIDNFDTSLVTNIQYMFYECFSLVYLNINNFNTSLVDNMQNLFSGCKSLLSIDLSKFRTSLVNNMEYMFSDCISLISLDLTKFDTSKVTNMEYMFFGCSSLKYLDLLYFNTSLVNNMNSMFYNCISLTSLDLSKFNTTKVRNMQSMFYGCNNLRFLDISNFDTSLVTKMNSMFSKCNELTSFDLSKFNITSVEYIGSMFYSCTKMNYLNFYNYKEKNSFNANDLFTKGTGNLKCCISDEENSPQLMTQLNMINNVIREKAVIEKGICIDKCNEDNKYKYEYNNICYEECPKTSKISKIDNYLCDPIICEKYYNYDKTGCLDSIPDGYFLNNTIKKTIDQCHSDCKTCHEKESLNSTNCDSCKNSKYLNLGNCATTCPNDDYYEDSNNINNLRCKCSYNKKCSLCSLDSLKEDLCISCNNDYYPKEDDDINNNSFINCYKDLEGYYLDKENNIYKKCYSTCKNCEKGGNKTNNNCKECILTHIFKDDFENDFNCYEKCPFYYYFDSQKIHHCTINNECPSNYNKLIIEKNKCINECNKDNIYKYDYDNRCYKICPEGTSILNNKNFKCELICKNTFYIDLKNKKCLDNCDTNDFFNKICGLNFPTLINQQTHIKNIINEIENGNISLSNLHNNNLLLSDNNITYHITYLDSNINELTNISMIKFKNCEDILRTKYNINKTQKLVLFKTEYYISELNIPIVDYEIFNPDNNEKLNLNHCINENIEIYLPVNIKEDTFKYEPSSNYYNDICFPYKTEFGSDIIISDRRGEFNQKYMSLCEKDCEYKSYNDKTKRVICECKIKVVSSLLTNKTIEKDDLLFQFKDINDYNKGTILKCYLTLFSNEGIEVNIANYIIIFIFLIYSFQLCSLHKKTKDLFNNNNFYEIFGNKNIKNPPRKDIKHKTTLYNDLRSSFQNKRLFKKLSLSNKKLKSSKTLKSKESINKDIINSILNNLKYEENSDKNRINNMDDYEINLLNYKEAKKYDKRSYCQYYVSLLKTKYILTISFSSSFDYFLKYVYRCLLINSFILFYLINMLFFTESLIHNIYSDKGYKIKKHLDRIIYSTILSSGIINLIKYFLFFPRKNFSDLHKFKYNENALNKTGLKCYTCKNMIIFLLMYLFIFFSWYYLSAFCAVYKNTQVHLFINVLICYVIFLIYPLFFNLIPGFFRLPALHNTKKSSECIYNISKVIQSLC